MYNTEGYANKFNVTGGPFYQYYRKDHLGNNREVWCANNATILQRTHYYPSGLPWHTNTGIGADVQNRKYNGKEFVEMHGLDEYDSEARWYYPAIMRTTTMDPLAEKYYSISPYAWCGNNPVLMVDPDGRAFETAWDLASLVTGAKSFVSNVKQGNVGAAILDGVGIVADAAAVLVPGVPGGVGAGIKAVRAADKMVDVAKTGKAAENVVEGVKTAGKYNDVPNPRNVGPGKATTPSQRKNILTENQNQNAGHLISDGDGRILNPPKKNIKGQKADMNQAEVDHIDPKSKGGTNANSNLRVISKEENLKKGNK